MTPDDAWNALNSAPEHKAPPCEDLDLFTADRLTPEERTRCESVCASCPLLAVCDAYAVTAKVQAGFWAGYLYTLKGRK